MRKKYGLLILGMSCLMLFGCGEKKNATEPEGNAGMETLEQAEENAGSGMLEQAEESAGSGMLEQPEESAGSGILEQPEESASANAEDHETDMNTWLSDMQSYEQESESQRRQRREAYLEVLWNMIENGYMADGSENEIYYGDMSENSFWIGDIDGDEKEELLIDYLTTNMASMKELMYEYDMSAQEMREEFVQFPSTAYYSNGVVKVDFSHNQGLGPDFWPFFLYRYDPENDSYVCVGSVDTWDKSYYPLNPYTQEEFPDAVDLDGDGIVYALSEDESVSVDYIFDGADYDRWFQTWVGEDVYEIEISWLPLTEESLSYYMD